MKFPWNVSSFAIGLAFFCIACGNGGGILFLEPSQPSVDPSTGNKTSSFNLIPASQALMVESGKTPANGYHAKMQMTPIGGQKFTAAGGYKAKLKYTTRNGE